MKKTPKGYGVIEVVMLLAVIALLVLSGWLVYIHHHKTTTPQSTKTSKSTAKNNNAASSTSSDKLSLASGKVTLTVPAEWSTRTESVSGCESTRQSTVTCVDVDSVYPNSVGSSPTQPAYAGATVDVYQNTNNMTAEDWFNSDYETTAIDSSELSQASTQPVNGYSAYSFELTSPNDFADVYYVFTDQNYVVMVYSRVLNYESANGSAQTNDYTQYVPTVKAFADSVDMAS